MSRLNRGQARSELYALFLVVLLGAIGAASLSPALPHGGVVGASVYAFAGVIAAVVLGLIRHVAAAAFCATAPVGALLYFVLYGFQPGLGAGDRIVLVVIVLLSDPARPGSRG